MPRLSLVVALLFALAATAVGAQPAPTELPGLAYDVEFFPGTEYDDSIPTQQEILGFRAGDRAAFPAEIERALRVWDEASPRTRLVEYAESYEGRSLYYMIVTSPENMARLDEIKNGMARLADPRGLDDAEAERLLASLPVPAWLAYSIHGDETSGSDGALAVLYHLTAGLDSSVVELLENVVVLIDPMMNPDGRHRFLQQIAEHRAAAPNVDDQSLLHSGYWPWGRGNHYHFDLNRDWILGVNPETRGRIRAAAEWHPLLFVDAHEMGSQDTYLFAPAREPRNPHFPSRRAHWASVFARQQSEAFDRYHWLYYTGEWNEGWYPGYSDSWGEFRGAVGILYEQARIAEDAVLRPEGTLMTYREATHHQAVSSLANLQTLERNADALLAEFLAEKRRAVSPSGPYADRTFAVLPTDNRTRLAGFLDQMELQGFEVYVTERELAGRSGVDQLGRRFTARTLPAGTLLIPNRQPEAYLLATMLEFDRPMPPDYLERERSSVVRGDGTTIYDVTTWNLTMMHGLDALTLDGDLPAEAVRYRHPEMPQPAADGPIVAWVIDGVDDASVAAAARLMEQGVQVRVARREFELDGTTYTRGSLLLLPVDNAVAPVDLATTLATTAGDLGLAVSTVSTGLGEGDLPDIGGGHFALLERPRIALVGRGYVSTTDYGAIWHALDTRLGIRHSQLDIDALSYTDLRRYNVVVLPHLSYGGLPAR
ncbi:MAG: M14 family zinc carboxypeptidase, partial [Thermoanaerobaculia bacterium]|nr:M14 family zinc carboxypeptidase [Thermoanaerobaculia bacterium]